eukprot:TRINITY_DN233_c0_g1_i3.p2 TRINITY_DN233_c0_g1~~TRINITY_DN233_c0_g1_i3.p2  ORF type:complete len:734 (-),score=162.87 TRINITY_DN233_c0_g1_i3:2338-4461(-)
MDNNEIGVGFLGSQLIGELRLDPHAFLAFYSYLKSQYCLESLNFFLEVEEYVSFPQHIRAIKEKAIIDKYIANGAPHQVNVNFHIRRDTLAKAGAGKAQIFDDALAQVTKLLQMNMWDDFQRAQTQELKGKKPTKPKPLHGKALKKAFAQSLDPDVLTAGIWEFTHKRVTKQEMVQLKNEQDLHAWLVDTDNDALKNILHDALSTDLDLVAVQAIFYLLSTHPEVLRNFLAFTARTAISSRDPDEEDSDAPDYVPRGRSRTRSLSPTNAPIFSRGSFALTLIEEYVLYAGESWLKKVLKKVIAKIYGSKAPKLPVFLDVNSIPGVLYSKLSAEEQASYAEQAAQNRVLVKQLAEEIIDTLVLKPALIPDPIIQLCLEVYTSEKEFFPDSEDATLLKEGPGLFILYALNAVLSSPFKLFKLDNMKSGLISRPLGIFVSNCLTSLVSPEVIPTRVGKEHQLYLDFASTSGPIFEKFLANIVTQNRKEKNPKLKAKLVAENLNNLGHYLSSNGSVIAKRFNSKQLGALKSFLTKNALNGSLDSDSTEDSPVANFAFWGDGAASPRKFKSFFLNKPSKGGGAKSPKKKSTSKDGGDRGRDKKRVKDKESSPKSVVLPVGKTDSPQSKDNEKAKEKEKEEIKKKTKANGKDTDTEKEEAAPTPVSTSLGVQSESLTGSSSSSSGSAPTTPPAPASASLSSSDSSSLSLASSA